MQSKFVYVRVDSHRKPLQRLYDGPFRVISTGDKIFVLDINGRQEKISVDRLKPAFIENHSPTSVATSSTIDPETTFPIPTDCPSHDDTPSMTTTHRTRSRRQRRFPRYLRIDVASRSPSLGGGHVATINHCKYSCNFSLHLPRRYDEITLLLHLVFVCAGYLVE